MPENRKPLLSLSLDLDNTWSYLKIHGDENWQEAPSHFPVFIPIFLETMRAQDLKATVFIVGRDAENKDDAAWLSKLTSSGHDVGNHSFNHEPWMQSYSEEKIIEEISHAHRAISAASGKDPIGFRGPGFCQSKQLLDALTKMGYRYDASLLATIIGPIARLYYLLNAKRFKDEEKEKREVLFGSFSNAFRPNVPFIWKTKYGKLLEVPVTTMPLFRTPIHLSYLIWLSQFSKFIAKTYLKMWIALSKQLKVAPSILLHPPDFLGKEDLPALSFFPGMNLSRNFKLEFVNEIFQELKQHFEIVTLNEHVKSIETHSEKLKEHELC